ncbi:MAG: AraC family transcriptional regulator [Geminicoccaceae bacterium]
MKQELNLSAPPLGKLPEWGKRFDFETFFVELVPAGKRSFNVRLAETFASISFSADEGRSSLAGDRLRRYDRRAYATGFSSQSHLTTTFKRELGMTPAQLRNQAER